MPVADTGVVSEIIGLVISITLAAKVNAVPDTDAVHVILVSSSVQVTAGLASTKGDNASTTCCTV